VVDAMMQEVHAKLARSAAGASDPLQAIERGIGAFLRVCAEPSVQGILLVDAPAVLGWPKWRQMDAKYGFDLLKQALAAAIEAGQSRSRMWTSLRISCSARSPKPQWWSRDPTIPPGRAGKPNARWHRCSQAGPCRNKDGASVTEMRLKVGFGLQTVLAATSRPWVHSFCCASPEIDKGAQGRG
jgi:hypothetical protein